MLRAQTNNTSCRIKLWFKLEKLKEIGRKSTATIPKRITFVKLPCMERLRFHCYFPFSFVIILDEYRISWNDDLRWYRKPFVFFDAMIFAVGRAIETQHRLIIPAGNRIFAIRWVSESRDFRDRYPRGWPPSRSSAIKMRNIVSFARDWEIVSTKYESLMRVKM